MDFKDYMLQMPGYKRSGFSKDRARELWDYQQKEIDKITEVTTDYIGVKLEQITQLKEELKKEREVIDKYADYSLYDGQIGKKARLRQKERTIKEL